MERADQPRHDASQGLRPGMSFGAYDIVRCIGIGGMGSVFEAEHRLMQRRVALKVLHASMPATGGVDSRQRFLREGAMLVRVEHPNVVAVYDAGMVDGLPFLAMELLEGATFDRIAAKQGRLTPRRAVDLVADAAEGLEAAHQVGIVHRDVKPENLFVAKGPRGREIAKLVDFGIAKDFKRGSDRNTAIGTPAYMSPEQLLGGHPIDGRCDQYALAVVLYEALTGTRPYDAPSLVELAIKLERGEAEPPSARGVPISTSLDAVIMRALSVDPADRFSSMSAFAAALRGSITSTVDLDESLDRVTLPATPIEREAATTIALRKSSFPPPSKPDSTMASGDTAAPPLTTERLAQGRSRSKRVVLLASAAILTAIVIVMSWRWIRGADEADLEAADVELIESPSVVQTRSPHAIPPPGTPVAVAGESPTSSAIPVEATSASAPRPRNRGGRSTAGADHATPPPAPPSPPSGLILER